MRWLKNRFSSRVARSDGANPKRLCIVSAQKSWYTTTSYLCQKELISQKSASVQKHTVFWHESAKKPAVGLSSGAVVKVVPGSRNKVCCR